MADPLGQLEPGNIDLHNRPRVRNADGSVSTVRSVSMNFGDGEVLLPTVSDDGRIMTDDEAADQYRKTGRHLGRFSTPDHADAYAQQLHNDQEREYVGTESPMADDTPQALSQRAADMVRSKGAPLNAENLNRASLALARGQETTDFDAMLDGAANGRNAAPKPRKPAANQNKPPETPKAGDGPAPTNTNAQTTTQPAQAAARAAREPSPSATGSDEMGMYLPGGKPQTMDTVTASTAPKPQGMTVEQYIDSMTPAAPYMGNPTGGDPVSTRTLSDLVTGAPGAQASTSLPLKDRVPQTSYTGDPNQVSGSVAPVQSNPTVSPQTANAVPTTADAAQQPVAGQPQSFQDYLASKGGSRQFVEDFLRRPETGLLMGGRGLNVGAGLAGGARGVLTRPMPPVVGSNTALRPGAVPPPDLSVPPGPSMVGGGGTPALPSSYGPPIPRGNLNTVPPQGPIPMGPTGNTAIPMGTPRPISTPRITNERGNTGAMQDTRAARQAAINALIRSQSGAR
jgi:hypothetical protein